MYIYTETYVYVRIYRDIHICTYIQRQKESDKYTQKGVLRNKIQNKIKANTKKKLMKHRKMTNDIRH